VADYLIMIVNYFASAERIVALEESQEDVYR
jgi:hypothetical protein